jgi:hypothetical protein
MKATVYFVRLTDADIAEINDPNGKGWGTEVGKKYLLVTDTFSNKVSITDYPDMYEVAAVLETNGSAEGVFAKLQNMSKGWNENPDIIEVFTDFPRSMSVGDYIIWDDGKIERVSSMGFETIDESDI